MSSKRQGALARPLIPYPAGGGGARKAPGMAQDDGERKHTEDTYTPQNVATCDKKKRHDGKRREEDKDNKEV